MPDDGWLLAIQRADKGTWELPGGVLELEETPQKGVRPEVPEETTLHVARARRNHGSLYFTYQTQIGIRQYLLGGKVMPLVRRQCVL